MHPIVSILAFVAAAVILLGVFFPRLRPYWRGGRIRVGGITCAAFALGLIGLGAAEAMGAAVSRQFKILAILAILAALPLLGLGQYFEFRAFGNGVDRAFGIGLMLGGSLIIIGFLLFCLSLP